jgi:transcription initiation factor IIF auxiliary subunit
MVAFNNFAQFIEKRHDRPYFRWKLFVDEPDSVLDRIEQVEYKLHPTFPQPHQIRKNRADKFALETAGWGEFTLLIDVKFRNGSTETVAYWLDLKKQWPNEGLAIQR